MSGDGIKRKNNGQFAKGSSGNAGGRSPQALSSQAIRKALIDDIEPILLTVKSQALAGDLQACKMLLDRTCAVLKPISAPPALSDLTTESINEALLAGTTDLESAHKLASIQLIQQQISQGERLEQLMLDVDSRLKTLELKHGQ